ncbi:MAG: glycoside hydrolase family 88 protein [Candidatus Aminicenantes bacterium]|nr:glycoside hydrolase family 88 protein [Candidatus Aminicenantes bacterium]
MAQLRNSLEKIPVGRFPIRTKGLGAWELTLPEVWTSGFYPGCLWLAYQLSGDPFWVTYAQKYTEQLNDQQFNTGHHDVGFMILNSFGNGYKYNKNADYKSIILQAANSLATRYNKNVGCIQSWNGEFQVIIDNIMNLEILFWASKNGGDKRLYDIAVNHAKKTIENHLREDGSSFHVVVYDPATGKVKEKRTAQGYSSGSTWARGQAWGTYGFTMCFRETQDKTYLNAAVKMADYFIAHLPPDFIPFWDFNLPQDHPKQYKDSSAAAIFLSGLFELRDYVKTRPGYDDVIEHILEALVRDYLSMGTESSGILLHGAYNANSDNPYDRDASTIWGDYYFLEALERHMDYSESRKNE